jgi:hypothetical protein
MKRLRNRETTLLPCAQTLTLKKWRQIFFEGEE